MGGGGRARLPRTADENEVERLEQSFLVEPHDKGASPYTAGSLPSPEMYAFEEIGRKTAGGLRNTLLDRFYPTQTEMNQMGEKGKALAIQKQQFNKELTRLLPNSLDDIQPEDRSQFRRESD